MTNCKIAIDCRMIDASGIGVYLSNLLKYLLADSSASYFLIGHKEKIEKHVNVGNNEIIETDLLPFSIKELLFFPVKEINKCDVFYSPNYNIPLGIKIPIAITIHDVLFLDIPHLTSYLGYLIRYVYLKYAILRSNLVFTVSNFSKERILYHFPKSKGINVIHNGISSQFLSSSKSRTMKYSFPYFLYVGNIKPHKGLKTLLKAYNKLEEGGETRKLVIVGNMNKFKTADTYIKELIERGVLSKNIIFTGYVSDDELVSIMQNADLLIQPSLYEGFGIPPLESLFLGTPVLISDIPVFKEIYNDFPVQYFSCNDVSDLYNKMKNFVRCRIKLSDELRGKYSYEKSASILLDMLKQYGYASTSCR